MFIKNVVGIHKFKNTIIYDFLEYFRKECKNRYGHIISYLCEISCFKFGNNPASFSSTGKIPSVNDLLIK